MEIDKTEIIVWQALSWPSTIIHTHTINGDIHDYGLAVGKTDEGIPFAMEYEVALTEDWDIKEVSIKSLLDERVIKLVRRGDRWYDGEGKHLAGFDGVGLVDISISPFTNTLPIRRLQFEGERTQKVDVIYFDENKFSISRLQQIYSRVNERIYRYQDILLPDFVSDITVDSEGLVMDFPKMFKRV
ncbi:putative glycolipid-binding domain-containing protein [Methanosarcina hadiensis]|uniref:putative glycolipid-binding domain-containing protein n=1 Tax=Methanosarcina hadiensis TaxID=3078083 RepID=UPI0039776A3B